MKGKGFHCRRLFFVFSLVFVRLSFCSEDVEPKIIEEWAHNIGATIHEFAVRVTGSAAVEKELGTLPLKVDKINGTKLARNVSDALRELFNRKIHSLRKVVAKAEEFHESYTNDNDIEVFDYMNMKTYNSSQYNLTYAPAFNENVTLAVSGVQVPTDIYDRAAEILNTIKWTASLDEVFKNNSKTDPELKWQFFGSETGVFRLYPAMKWPRGRKGIDLYDARNRPWYIHGSASPKSVVIIVDSSGSMYGRPMLIARLAVGELIDTLSENDYFNVIWFNKVVHYLACEKKFIQATTQNKEFFKHRLKEMEAGYVAIWSKAFEAAFVMLNEDVGAKCQKAIMVFTDGPTERSSEVFKKYNADKKVRVFTYAVGPPAHSIEALRAIACGNKGYFYRIPGVGSVRDVVKGYVSVLSRPMAENDTHDPIWSSAYMSISGSKMTVTGTLPIFHRPNQTGVARILGVTGTDVPLDEFDALFTDPTLFGADGYFFLINNNGHIVKHPGLKASRGYLKDSSHVNVSEMEFGWKGDSKQPSELERRMLNISQQEVETMTFNVASFLNDEFHRRVKKRTMEYYFTTIEDTPFRVGVAIPKSSSQIVGDPGYSDVNETVLKFSKKHWVNQTLSEDNLEMFVQTYTGAFKMSSPNANFKPEKGIKGRIDDYPNDITVLTAPFSSGEDDVMNNIVTGYRKISTNASGTVVNVAVVGFNVNYSRFHEDYFIGPSTKSGGHSCNRTDNKENEGYYCYLLDENAFVVGANANLEVIGQFFGKVDEKIMKQLVKGVNSSLSHPLYEKVVKQDHQGTCLDPSDGTTNSAPFLQPLLSVTSYTNWFTTKAILYIAQLNIYNWLFAKSASVSADSTEIEKPKNRSCIMEIVAYYASVTDTNSTQQGEACCETDCFDKRPFVVSKVPKTNLFLVVVSASHGWSATRNAGAVADVPGQPKKVEQSNQEVEASVCTKDSFRKTISRCYISDNPETDYPCGRCSLASLSVYLLILTLLNVLCDLAS